MPIKFSDLEQPACRRRLSWVLLLGKRANCGATTQVRTLTLLPDMILKQNIVLCVKHPAVRRAGMALPTT